MKRRLLFALMLVAAGFTGCKKDDTPVLQSKNPETGEGIAPGGCYPPNVNCATVLCTAHFAEVDLEVSNAAGLPVTVDSFVVTDPAGIPLPPAAGGLPVYGYTHAGNGRYTVINDGWTQGHRNSIVSVRAKGFIAGVKVFDEPYTIVTDCCHVGKQSGKDSITIP